MSACSMITCRCRHGRGGLSGPSAVLSAVALLAWVVVLIPAPALCYRHWRRDGFRWHIYFSEQQFLFLCFSAPRALRDVLPRNQSQIKSHAFSVFAVEPGAQPLSYHCGHPDRCCTPLLF